MTGREFVGQLQLDGPVPHAELDAVDEKHREGDGVVIRDDLVADLRAWLAERLSKLQEDARRASLPIPVRLPADQPVFRVPEKLNKICNRELKAAGITRRDERDSVLDVRSLRHTFGRLLSKGGVSQRPFLGDVLPVRDVERYWEMASLSNAVMEKVVGLTTVAVVDGVITTVMSCIPEMNALGRALAEKLASFQA